MKIDCQYHGTITVLTPHGPLAADELTVFRQKLEVTREQRGSRIVLDLADVPFLDSAGIETLLEFCGGTESMVIRPRLAQVGDTCREALDLTDVLGRLDVFDTVESAVRS